MPARRSPSRRVHTGHSARVGDHRVVCTIDNGELVVWVVHVGHRSTVHGTRPPLTTRQNIQRPSSTGTTKGSGSSEPDPFRHVRLTQYLTRSRCTATR
ncbi:type II toxin-antitoxin system RelE/ParE family toxin [Streptomyces sp. me109]|nr:type II toxin-antitoxin system RelE/ParE family toxin [Streptomyces sp. me109]